MPVRLSTPEDKLLVSNSSGSASASKAQQLQLKAIQRPKLSGQHPKISSGTIAPPPVNIYKELSRIFIRIRIFLNKYSLLCSRHEEKRMFGVPRWILID